MLSDQFSTTALMRSGGRKKIQTSMIGHVNDWTRGLGDTKELESEQVVEKEMEGCAARRFSQADVPLHAGSLSPTAHQIVGVATAIEALMGKGSGGGEYAEQ